MQCVIGWSALVRPSAPRCTICWVMLLQDAMPGAYNAEMSHACLPLTTAREASVTSLTHMSESRSNWVVDRMCAPAQSEGLRIAFPVPAAMASKKVNGNGLQTQTLLLCPAVMHIVHVTQIGASELKIDTKARRARRTALIERSPLC
jgi:hypothetical protein